MITNIVLENLGEQSRNARLKIIDGLIEQGFTVKETRDVDYKGNIVAWNIHYTKRNYLLINEFYDKE